MHTPHSTPNELGLHHVGTGKNIIKNLSQAGVEGIAVRSSTQIALCVNATTQTLIDTDTKTYMPVTGELVYPSLKSKTPGMYGVPKIEHNTTSVNEYIQGRKLVEYINNEADALAGILEIQEDQATTLATYIARGYSDEDGGPELITRITQCILEQKPTRHDPVLFLTPRNSWDDREKELAISSKLILPFSMDIGKIPMPEVMIIGERTGDTGIRTKIAPIKLVVSPGSSNDLKLKPSTVGLLRAMHSQPAHP